MNYMDIEHSNFWENLVKEIEPIMDVGEDLLEETISLVERYHIDLSSELNWDELPDAFKNALQVSISNNLNTMSNDLMLNEFIRSGSMFQTVVDMLEVQHSKLERNDTTARSFLQNLIREVMSVSISSKAMNLDNWSEIISNKKEAYQVDDVTEHAYKKIANQLKPRMEICIYDFFYNKYSPDEIDKWLGETKNNLLLASIHREHTKKRGQGMSRFIIDYIHHWQDAELMKPMRSVFPFCQCLQQYWNNEINLGTRQGLEALYKQRL